MMLKNLRYVHPLTRFFSTSTHPLLQKALPPRPTIPDSDLIESFLKGSGPGGQKINKTSSAVQLKHVPTGIVVKSQHTRSRAQNRKYARQILAEKLDVLENGDESRTAIKTEMVRKKKASADKKKKRKYRKLDGGKEEDVEAEEEDAEEGGVGVEFEGDEAGVRQGKRDGIVSEKTEPS